MLRIVHTPAGIYIYYAAAVPGHNIESGSHRR